MEHLQVMACLPQYLSASTTAHHLTGLIRDGDLRLKIEKAFSYLGPFTIYRLITIILYY